MKNILSFFVAFIVLLIIPHHLFAQLNVANGVQQMHAVLNGVYDQMMPLCEQVLKVCQSVAAFGATFYIGNKVWKHIANAEQIDFYPLLRPFALILCISMFPNVMRVINGILEPTVTATAAIVTTQNNSVVSLLQLQQQAIAKDTAWQVLVGPTGDGDRQGWYKYTHPNSGSESFLSSIGNDFKFMAQKLVYNIRYFIRYMISIILEIIYFAAALCIDCIRTFHMIVLTILGPFAFAFSCYDGLHQSLTHWLARYINIYLWLPVANLFGAIIATIQANMLQIDLGRVESGSMTIFTPTDLAYLIFLVIGAIGYLTVPGVANYIIHTHGGNPLAEKASRIAGGAMTGGVNGAVSQAIPGASGPAPGGGSGLGGGIGSSGAGSFGFDKIAGL